MIHEFTQQPSFRQGLPEPSGQGWFGVVYIPVLWIPAIPAGMTAWLDELNEAFAA